ncbi:MAG TPA: class I SAM-dependent methyltransferase [Terriglobia bacterium]|nr:class I SAM-dependent methyltransferase [Terriglobia bacterium]
MKPEQPKLYYELAPWFHLLTAPSSYEEEAAFAQQVLTESCPSGIGTVMELGAGGGNNAFHLKKRFRMTLTDLSPSMLDQSRSINPECEHLAGDMRSIRLDREFDGVFIHDAVCYLTEPDDLIACMKTAFVHCRPGGVALFMPDAVKERFRPSVHHGGHDGETRSLRYFEWTFDPDPSDSSYTVDFVYLLREANRPVHVVHDTHALGLFSREQWLLWLREAGFSVRMIEDPYEREVFVGVRNPV